MRARALAPALVLANSFALVKTEFLLAVRTRRVVDALIAFGLVILPMVAMVLAMVLAMLLLSADPTTAAPGGAAVCRSP